MKTYSAEDVRQGLDWPVLIAALKTAFAQGVEAPLQGFRSCPRKLLLRRHGLQNVGGHDSVRDLGRKIWIG